MLYLMGPVTGEEIQHQGQSCQRVCSLGRRMRAVAKNCLCLDNVLLDRRVGKQMSQKQIFARNSISACPIQLSFNGTDSKTMRILIKSYGFRTYLHLLLTIQ
jgi:hypothetical protein